MFLKSYLIGVALGILACIYVYLKTRECCKKENFPHVNKVFFTSASVTFKTILFLLTPYFGYLMFLAIFDIKDYELERDCINIINRFKED